VCAGAILESIPAIARQLGELSKFQPVLKKIFTPGESTGEALAWIGLVIALSPVTLAVLAHHNLLKPDTLERLAGFVNVGKASLDVEPAA
jgi:cytochrome b561